MTELSRRQFLRKSAEVSVGAAFVLPKVTQKVVSDGLAIAGNKAIKVREQRFKQHNSGLYVPKTYTPVPDETETPTDDQENKEPEHNEIELPILYFHEIPSQSWFSNYILDLLARDYYPTSLGELNEFFKTGKINWKGQPVILTFDDGLKSQADNAVPFLKQFKIPAVFAVIPTYQDGVHKYMAEDQIKDLADFGFEIASHTFTHPFLSKLRVTDEEKWRRDIVDSKYYLENLIGKPVNIFVYPNGDADKQTLLLVSQNYDFGLSTLPGNLQKSADRDFLHRTRVN